MEIAVFLVAAIAVLGGALGVVLARNPVHSALLLVLTLVGVAVFFVLQQANLVAAVQVIVYAGAIVVLFLFVIMLLGVDEEESLAETLPGQRQAALALGVIVLTEILFLAGRTWATGARSARGSLHQAGKGNVRLVAETLFTKFLWPFEITSVLLVVAVVGAIVLARRSSNTSGGSSDRNHEETVP